MWTDALRLLRRVVKSQTPRSVPRPRVVKSETPPSVTNPRPGQRGEATTQDDKSEPALPETEAVTIITFEMSIRFANYPSAKPYIIHALMPSSNSSREVITDAGRETKWIKRGFCAAREVRARVHIPSSASRNTLASIEMKLFLCDR